MLSPLFEKLLILQDRDSRRLAIDSQLKSTPREIAAAEQKIAAEKAAIDAARTELRELEARKKSIENDIGSAEDRLTKYKNQQLQIRKNDEFQALGQEITNTQTSIEGFEEQELQVMYAIDEAKKRFATSELELKRNIAGHEGRIQNLKEREKTLIESLKAAESDFIAARSGLDEATLRVYDRISTYRQPVCVPIRAGKCGGCHLKVSSEAESASRGKNPDIKLPVCDQCGRIIYWES